MEEILPQVITVEILPSFQAPYGISMLWPPHSGHLSQWSKFLNALNVHVNKRIFSNSGLKIISNT